MAKIFDPSGETEFFEITELQQAFEKELKSGEKVTFNAGIKEGSILREAPIRADLVGFYQEFKDRILNPYIPPQPPVTRFKCTAVLRPMILEISYTQSPCNPPVFDFAPTIRFTTVIDTSQGYYPVPSCDQDFVAVLGDPNEYDYIGSPFVNVKNRSHPSSTQIIVPDYYRLTCSTVDFLPDDDASLECLGVNITAGLGGGVSYSSGAINCNSLTAESAERPIFELLADLYVPAYSDPVKPYSLSSCSYTLFNYRFTNLFP
jgi:hypothetical protein